MFLAFLVAAIAIQPAAPAKPPDPWELRVGRITSDFSLPGEPAGRTFPLIVQRIETLTLLAETTDADCDLFVESTSGEVLARDADSGTETNAHLVWTPREPGTYLVRVRVNGPAAGSARVSVLRGALDATVPEPALAARGYWQLALDRAGSRGDTTRATLALERLAAIHGTKLPSEVAQARAPIDEAVRDARGLLKEAEEAEKVRDFAAAREKLAQARERLQSAPGAVDDAVVASVWGILSPIAQAAGDIPSQLQSVRRIRDLAERTFPRDHPSLQVARINAGSVSRRGGDLAASRALLEDVVRVRSRILPEDDPALLNALNEYAITLGMLGDLQGSRVVFERVLAARERTLPEGDPGLARARINCAVALASMGDYLGARAIEDRLITELEKSRAPSDAQLLTVWSNHAGTLSRLGDHAGARRLHERVLTALRTVFPDDHEEIILERFNLAETLWQSNERIEARRHLDEVLALREKSLPSDHPDLQSARTSLATMLQSLGDLEGSRDLVESALVHQVKMLDGDHPELARTRRLACSLFALLGQVEQMETALRALVAGDRLRLARATLLSRREAIQSAAGSAADVSALLSFTPISNADLGRSVFGIVELRRVVATGDDPRARAVASDPEIRERSAAVAATREQSAALLAGIRATDAKRRPTADAIARAAAERDRTEKALRQALAERGVTPIEIDVASLAKALPEGAAAVGFVRYQRQVVVRGEKPRIEPTDSWMAHVVRRDGSLARVDLGASDEIEKAVEQWRAALGQPIRRSVESGDSQPVSGVPPPSPARSIGQTVQAGRADERAAGETLRARLLDPVLRAVGDVTTLHVCLDDLLHLVPLDALPLGEAFVGDRYRVCLESSFARLLSPSRVPTGSPLLVAIGAVDYGARGVASESLPLGMAPPVPVRGGPPETLFSPLPATGPEVAAIAALFEGEFRVPAHTLTGAQATKAAFSEAVSRSRILHVATHGYFAGEDVVSSADLPPGQDSRSLSFEEAVVGFAPMTLCGFALAGANGGIDESGRVPGIVTAEELAGLDLHQCDLAVLSACETHVGLHRAGQGIHSLQSALHAAGARSTVTSLWAVEDATCRELMAEFYRRLIAEKRSRSQALWEAKNALRARGARTPDWAGWILCGDPGLIGAVSQKVGK